METIGLSSALTSLGISLKSMTDLLPEERVPGERDGIIAAE